MGFNIWGDQERLLTGAEERLIKQVFRTTKLPVMSKIRIRNGLSWTGTPITTPRGGPVNVDSGWPVESEGEYLIMVGQRLFNGDVAVQEDSTLVHEMTHVWQYKHGTLTEFHGAAAHALYGIPGKTNSLYKYKIGQSWDAMGFEGQAQLVEDWYTLDNMSETVDRWYYVLHVLMLDEPSARSQSLDTLKAKTETYVPEDNGPHREISFENIPFSESYLLGLLNENVTTTDVAKMASRIKYFEEYFRQYHKIKTGEALTMAARLDQNNPSDPLARAFHYRLSTGTRTHLVMLLRGLG
ncbi:MAG: hypothetical protein ABI791_04480 [Acidobacteriota bacterium]